jgi:hypothetical protein
VNTKAANSGTENTRADDSKDDLLRRLRPLIDIAFGGTFIGLVIILVSLQIGDPVGGYALGVGMGIFGFALVRSRPSARDWRLRNVIYFAVAFAFGYYCFPFFLSLAELLIRGLALMAAGGTYGADKTKIGYLHASLNLLFAMFWLLFAIPHRAFKYKLDPNGEGSAQQTSIGLLASMVSAIAGEAILLLHYGNGPLSAVPTRTLIVGDIFTVFLIYPICRSVAQAFWQRGARGALPIRQLKTAWSATLAEASKASVEHFQNLAARRDSSPSSRVATRAFEGPAHTTLTIQSAGHDSHQVNPTSIAAKPTPPKGETRRIQRKKRRHHLGVDQVGGCSSPRRDQPLGARLARD